jgi:DNA helicase-2/ATP-dependent DNA helicase PcrA
MQDFMSEFQPLLDQLNPQQLEAVTTADGPMLVVAGAGSGKTRVITYRIAWLIREQGIEPGQVFAATFTNKAAGEMQQRVDRLIPDIATAHLSVSTFHSQCVSILRREALHAGLTSRFTICDDSDQIALIKDCMRKLEVSKQSINPEEIRRWIQAAKIRMLEPDEAISILQHDFSPACGAVYRMYQERLQAHDAVDFDDLILKVVRIFSRNGDVLKRYHERWRYLLVDEYQDTNRVQFELIRLLASGTEEVRGPGNICVVGDEDQSIYSWRGAEIGHILQFPEMFPGTRIIRLEQNYRSRERILQAASHVIAHNRQRNEKTLWSTRGEGEPLTLIAGSHEGEEAAMVVDTMKWLKRYTGCPYQEMAVFYRVNALSRVYEDQLRLNDIPYRVIGGIKFYDRAEIRDLIGYLRLVENPRDGTALTRVMNRPARGIGNKSMATLFNDAVTRQVSIWDIMLELRDHPADGISGKARMGIINLILLINEWRAFTGNHPPRELLEKILRDTNYEEGLSGTEMEVISRRENIEQLLTALEEFEIAQPDDGLTGFLERVALVRPEDESPGADMVSLMSLHSAKGLEFDAVFMVGMEEPIFPSGRAIQENNIEEERRLFYVGITRARERLFLSRADRRMFYGRTRYNPPSLFLREIPEELVRTLDQAHQDWADLALDRQAEYQAESLNPASHDAAPPTVMTTDDLEDCQFPTGTRVEHKRLGPGEIIAVSGNGSLRKITVKFDAGLELEILEAFGGLVKLEQDADLPF